MSSRVTAISEQIIDKTAEIAKLANELWTLEKAKSEANQTALSKWLALIYDDGVLTSIEFQKLRDEADLKLNALKQVYPDSADLGDFQKVADDVVQLMQVGILSFKKKKLPPDARANIQEAYAFQVAYIQACLDRFTQML
jgi:hypothetical protein